VFSVALVTGALVPRAFWKSAGMGPAAGELARVWLLYGGLVQLPPHRLARARYAWITVAGSSCHQLDAGAASIPRDRHGGTYE